MCFRPPEAEEGEIVCQNCYFLAVPNPDGTCPECGELMRKPAPDAAAPAAPPAAPQAPGAPKPPAPPAAPKPPAPKI